MEKLRGHVCHWVYQGAMVAADVWGVVYFIVYLFADSPIRNNHHNHQNHQPCRLKTSKSGWRRCWLAHAMLHGQRSPPHLPPRRRVLSGRLIAQPNPLAVVSPQALAFVGLERPVGFEQAAAKTAEMRAPEVAALTAEHKRAVLAILKASREYKSKVRR